MKNLSLVFWTAVYQLALIAAAIAMMFVASTVGNIYQLLVSLAVFIYFSLSTRLASISHMVSVSAYNQVSDIPLHKEFENKLTVHLDFAREPEESLPEILSPVLYPIISIVGNIIGQIAAAISMFASTYSIYITPSP